MKKYLVSFIAIFLLYGITLNTAFAIGWPDIDVVFGCDSADITSSQALTNVVVLFCDDTWIKYDNLSDYTLTLQFDAGVKGVYVKSGYNYYTTGYIPEGLSTCGLGVYVPNPYGCDCEYDCLGDPNGSAVVDVCGVCDGAGPTLIGCNFAYYCEDPPVNDVCGVCDGDGSSCAPIEVCRRSASGLSAQVVTIQNDEYNATTDTRDLSQCDLVTICYDDNTKEVPKIIIDDFPGSYLGECIIENLECKVCAEVNAYLDQVNIVSIINVSDSDLTFTTTYTDMFGNVQQSLDVLVQPNTKEDIIINDMGLADDTYGTVCVLASETDRGLWRGGVTVYKRKFGTNFSSFEYALYYPFTNPKKGSQIVPLNSFRVGASKVAQWVRVIDSTTTACGKDGVETGIGVTGKLYIYQSNRMTELKCVYDVNIPPGGRYDFSAHQCLDDDHVGYAKLVPDDLSIYYTVTSTRYFANCHNFHSPFGCGDYLSAFVSPNTPASLGTSYNTISTVNNYFTVVEMSNPIAHRVAFDLVFYNGSGTEVGKQSGYIDANATRHIIVNDYGLPNGIGYAKITTNENIKTSTFVYKFDGVSSILSGVGFPFTKETSTERMVEFNSFLEQTTALEVVNLSSNDSDVLLVIRDAANVIIAQATYSLKSGEMVRDNLSWLPKNTYGTIVVHGDNILVRSFVIRDDEYQIPFVG